MQKLLITLLCMIINFLCYAQDFESEKTKAREKFYNEMYKHYWLIDDFCDTLLLEDGTHAFIYRTPIRHKKGYTGLFSTAKSLYDCEVIFTNHSGPGSRGYLITWRLKDKKLYLEKVWWNRLEFLDADENGELQPRKGPDVSPEEIRRRVEQLTSRKFNEEGLMFADWVVDRILIAKDDPNKRDKERNRLLWQSLDEILLNQSHTYLSKLAGSDKVRDDVTILQRKQKIFALDFMSGWLKEIHECTSINQKQLLNELQNKGK